MADPAETGSVVALLSGDGTSYLTATTTAACALESRGH